MKPLLRSRRRLVLVFAVLAALFWWYNDSHISPRPASSLPLITLIAVFKGDSWPSTLPYLFDSVRNQPEAVELVLLQRGGKCSDLKRLIKGAENIKHVCLSEKKFWQAHVDYLCNHWGNCSSSQRAQMKGDMVILGTITAPQSYYPLLRGGVFRKYLSPRTAFWGWCDLDIMLGSFKRTFPYDVALDNYDVITPTNPGASGGERLVFMPGHLTFFRHRPETEEKLLKYPSFTSFHEWDSDGASTICVEEAEFSSYVVGERSINYLAFTGLVEGAPLVALSPSGLYSLPQSEATIDELSPSLLRALQPADLIDTAATFSDDGLESNIQVIQDPPKGISLWFEPEYASYYVSQNTPRYGRWKRYLMKRNGRWTERLEPVSPNSEGLAGTGVRGAEEWLYVHWQEEKRRAHFRELLGTSSDIFLADLAKGTAGFDMNGKRLFIIPARNELCDNEGCVEPGQPRVQDSEEWHRSLEAEVEINRLYVESKSARKATQYQAEPTRMRL